jgi:hypothetical protein
MAKNKKSEEAETETISVEAIEPTVEKLPLIMSIAELDKLSPEQKEQFRRAGGTTTQH